VASTVAFSASHGDGRRARPGSKAGRFGGPRRLLVRRRRCETSRQAGAATSACRTGDGWAAPPAGLQGEDDAGRATVRARPWTAAPATAACGRSLTRAVGFGRARDSRRPCRRGGDGGVIRAGAGDSFGPRARPAGPITGSSRPSARRRRRPKRLRRVGTAIASRPTARRVRFERPPRARAGPANSTCAATISSWRRGAGGCVHSGPRSRPIDDHEVFFLAQGTRR